MVSTFYPSNVRIELKLVEVKWDKISMLTHHENSTMVIVLINSFLNMYMNYRVRPLAKKFE